MAIGQILILNLLYFKKVSFNSGVFFWEQRNICLATLWIVIGVYRFYDNWSTETLAGANKADCCYSYFICA